MNILVVCAHPDDEVLGMGGTISKWASLGNTLTVLILSEGVSSRIGHREIKERRSMARKASTIMGVKRLILKSYPDQKLDSIPLLHLSREVEHVLEVEKPEMVCTHFPKDLNQDHARVAEAVKVACRPVTSVKTLLFFEVPSSTEWQIPPSFSPNWLENITGFMNNKIKALECYDFEMRPAPHPRSYEGVKVLAMTRGFAGCVPEAEGFVLGRTIRS